MKPNYYQFPNGTQTLDIAQYLTANGFAGVKYLTRSCRLDGVNKTPTIQGRIKDLQKAKDHINAEIARLKKEEKPREEILTIRAEAAYICDLDYEHFAQLGEIFDTYTPTQNKEKQARENLSEKLESLKNMDTPNVTFHVGKHEIKLDTLSEESKAALQNFLEITPIKHN